MQAVLHPARNLWPVAVATALVLTMVFAGTALAAPPNDPLLGSTFQGEDGDQVDPAGSLTDWQTYAGTAAVKHSEDANLLDDYFEGGDKESEPYHWKLAFDADGVDPSKANVFNAWTLSDPNTSDVFLYLSFEREASTGNTFATFELNQTGTTWVNDRDQEISCRTNGDLLIAYNVESGGSPPNVDIVVYEWTSTEVDPDTGCGRVGELDKIDPQPFWQAGVNGEDITNFLTSPDSTLEEGTWGEAALNLTELITQIRDNPCFSFNTIYMHTRSSTSIDSQMQDNVSGAVLPLRSCAINVEKSGEDVVHHGDEMTFDFEVTNPGTADLSDVTVDDDVCPDVEYVSGDDGDEILQPDETWIYTCTMDVPDHADGEDDPIVNTVTATGHAGDNEVSDTDTHSTDILHPAIDMDKKVRVADSGDEYADGPIQAKPGDTLEYEFTVTNEGDVELAVDFSDDRCDTVPEEPDTGDEDEDGKLDVDETWIYTCSHVLTDEDDDPFTNTACVTGDDGEGGETEEVCDSTTTDILHPDIEIEKLVRNGDVEGDDFGETAVAHFGDTLEYQFSVTWGPDGDAPMTVEFDDDRCDTVPEGPDSGDDGDGLLEEGETWIYSCSHVIDDEEEDPVENTACVIGTDALGQTDDDCDSTTTDVFHPEIKIDKEVRIQGSEGDFVDGPIEAKVGDTLEYEFTVTNEGDIDLGVVLDDPRCDAGTISGPTGDTDGDERLDLDETWVYNCTHELTLDDPDPFENTACVIGTDPIGGETDEVCDSTSTEVLKPAIHIEKTVRVGSSGGYAESVKAHVGDTLDYRLEVTNTGDVELEVALSDPRCDASPAFQGGDTDSDGKLDLDETWVYGCSHVLTSADLAAGSSFPNTATAEGTDSVGQTVSDDDPASATILDPRINVDKLVSVGGGAPADSATAELGQTVNYQLTVTNPGNTPLAVELTDPRCDAPPAFQGGDSDGDNLLDVGEAWVYTCSHVIASTDPDPLVNTATATGTDELGGKASDDDTATVDILPPVGGALPEVVVPGAARLAGRTGCVSRAFNARVSGSRIARVVFTIDGKRKKTLRRPNSRGRFFVYRVNPNRYRTGAHRLVATVTFERASGTRTRRLRLTFLRCARKAAPPRFTG